MSQTTPARQLVINQDQRNRNTRLLQNFTACGLAPRTYHPPDAGLMEIVVQFIVPTPNGGVHFVSSDGKVRKNRRED